MIREVLGDPYISVSTTDAEGVNDLGLHLDAVMPPLVDIPYERVDKLARMFHYGRNSWRYKILSVVMLFCMLFQILLSVCSMFAVKLGLKSPYRGEVLDHLSDCDLVVSHSDESFKETASQLPLNPFWAMTWWSMLVSRTHEMLVAKSFRRPVVLFPNSVGPFRTSVGRLLARLSLNSCNCILIRDSISYEIVEKLSVKAQVVRILTYDTALLFRTDYGKNNLPFSQPVLGVCPGFYSLSLSKLDAEKYVVAHAGALDELVERYGLSVVFLPHYVSGFENDDLEISRSIMSKMKHKDRLELITAETVDEFKFLLEQTDMIVSSKMHPAVLGVSGFVPVLCIAYDHKQTSFFERLGMKDCLVDIRQVSQRNLASKMDYVWNQRGRLQEDLRKKIPVWQKHVRETIGNAIATYLETD
jgi:polysaccharide pyruvyl transferase WcaK-like protein